MGAVRLRTLTPRDPVWRLKPFVDVAWSINARDPAWVPPLRRSLYALLRHTHPFHRHAEVVYFLAERDGEAVGRVAALINHRHNEFHGERIGFFGFFESVPDPAVAGALLDAAAAWARERGATALRGPMNFSTNEECGLLIEGFARPPMLLMPHNPPYYARLLEDQGFAKCKDLVAYLLERGEVPAALERGAELALRRHRVRLRTLDLRRFREEVRRIQEVYNAAWQRNWGFVPLTNEEIEHLAKELRPIADPELCLFVERDDETIGFALALPNLNEALAHLRDGRLLPLGLPKLLWYRRRIRGMRLITLGFQPGFQHQGLGPLVYLQIYRTGVAKGYTHAEASWVLEDNWEMRRAIERIGGRVDKVYRIYERPL